MIFFLLDNYNKMALLLLFCIKNSFTNTVLAHSSKNMFIYVEKGINVYYVMKSTESKCFPEGFIKDKVKYL